MDISRRKNKFTCYFCNQTIENETEQGHTAVCGNVLLPCQNKCGSYVPRIEMQKHIRECLNRVAKSTTRRPASGEFQTAFNYSPSPVSTASAEINSNGHTLYHEMRKLHQKLALLEQKLLYNNQKMTTYVERENNYSAMSIQTQEQGLEIEKLKYQSKAFFDWRKNVERDVGGVKHALATAQNAKKNIEMRCMNIQEKINMLEKVPYDLNYLKEAIFKQQTENKEIQSSIGQDIRTFRNHYAQEAANFASILNDHTYAVETVKKDIEDIKKANEEATIKFTNLVFDLKAASQIASEAAEKIEILERDYPATKRELNQIKLDLEILESLVSSNDLHSRPGRLLWKVTEVSTKIERAKEFGSVLKSNVFFTHHYGYKIKILMYINGMKKWKDRYCLLSIQVLKGDYDMLLKWPCTIEGTVTLRNISESDTRKQFSKTIIAKRRNVDEEEDEPQESSSSYIFIPHSILLTKQYLKEDTFFLDIKILQNNKLETTL